MENVVLYLVLGLGSGALIAGVAIALVVFYRGSGVINLAAGAVSMVTGYAFWWLKGGVHPLAGGSYGLGLGSVPALVLALGVSVLVGVLMEFAVFRPLRHSPPLAKLIGSVGILLLAQSALQLAFGDAPQTEPSILTNSYTSMLGGQVPIASLILAGIVAVVGTALAGVYRWTQFGLATRAAAENEASAMLAGFSPTRLGLTNTAIGCLVAGGLGILAAPLISLDTQNLPLIVVPALAAALLARFTSVGLACFAGLAIGAAESLLVWVSTLSWFPSDNGAPMPGVADVLVFIVVVAALFWRGTSLPTRGELIERRLPIAPRPERILAPSVVAGIVGIVALIVFPFDFRQALMNSMIGTILVLSFVVVTGFVGQVSLMQLALSGVAGFVVSHLAGGAGVGFPVSLLLGALAATALGLMTAVTALRVRGVTLAIVTLAAAVALQNFGFNNSTWGGGQTGAPVPEPTFLGINLGNAAHFRGLDGLVPSPVLGFVFLGFAIALSALVANIRRGGLGQRMLAVRSNERASAAIGINVRNIKLIAFAIGSFIAGIAGVLYSYDFGSVSTNRFSALAVLSLIAFAYVGGITMVSGAAVAGILAVQGLSQYAFQKWLGIAGTWTVLVASIAVIGNVIFAPAGTSGMLYLKRRARSKRAQSGGEAGPDTRSNGGGVAGGKQPLAMGAGPVSSATSDSVTHRR